MDGQPQILTTLRADLPRLAALLKERDDPSRNASRAEKRVHRSAAISDTGPISDGYMEQNLPRRSNAHPPPTTTNTLRQVKKELQSLAQIPGNSESS